MGRVRSIIQPQGFPISLPRIPTARTPTCRVWDKIRLHKRVIDIPGSFHEIIDSPLRTISIENYLMFQFSQINDYDTKKYVAIGT